MLIRLLHIVCYLLCAVLFSSLLVDWCCMLLCVCCSLLIAVGWLSFVVGYWSLFDVCCVSFTDVGAQSSCLVYDVRCLLRFDCCCVGRVFDVGCCSLFFVSGLLRDV